MGFFKNFISNPLSAINLFAGAQGSIPGASDALKGAGQFLFGKEGKSTPQYIPAMLDPAQRAELISSIRSLGNTNVAPLGPAQTFSPFSFSSPFQGQYQTAVNSPYTPTAAENDVLNAVSANASAGFANRGLGFSPVSATDTAASIAPNLIEARSRHLANLLAGYQTDIQGAGLGLQARGQDIGAATEFRGQDVTGRGQDIGALQQKIAALLQLLETGGKVQPLGQKQNQGTPGLLPPVFNAFAGGVGQGVGSAVGKGVTG